MMFLLVGDDILNDGRCGRICVPQHPQLIAQVREDHAFHGFRRQADCPRACQTR
jgi:hypothetical protein